MIYLTLEQVLAIHDYQIEKFGGSHGLRDLGLLESAVMRPQASFGGVDMYQTVFEKAAALMHSLVLNHPFVDGNKRTALASALVFLELNSFQVIAKSQQLYNLTVQLALGEKDTKQVASFFKTHSKKLT